MKPPRFCLRLLLLAIAVLCAWLAWERGVVMERRAMLVELRSDPNFRVTTASAVAAMTEGWMDVLELATVSRLRTLFRLLTNGAPKSKRATKRKRAKAGPEAASTE